MRLNISTTLASLLVLSQAEAGPLRIGRILRRDENSSVSTTTTEAIPTVSASGDAFSGNVSAADGRGGSGRGGGQNGGSAGGITDPQEFPDETPSPEITTLIIDRTSAASPPESATSPPDSSETPSDTSNTASPTETPSSDPEAEPTPTEKGPDTEEGTTTVVKSLTTTATETVSPTDPPSPGRGKGKETATGAEESATGTSADFTSVFASSPADGETETGTPSTTTTEGGAEKSATDTSASFTSNLGPSATETGTPSLDTGAGAGAGASEPTDTPSSSDTPQQSAAPNREGVIPTLIEKPATTSVSPETLATLIQMSNEYNRNFASLKPDSPCQGTQVACVQGNIGRCKNGVFAIERCTQGKPCVALPMPNAPVVELRCEDKAVADKILNPEGTAPSESGSETGGASRVTVTVTLPEVIKTSEVTVPASPLPSKTESGGDETKPTLEPSSTKDKPKETPSPTATPEVPGDDTPGAPLPSEPVVLPSDVLDVIPIGESKAPETTVETAVLNGPDGGLVTVSITIVKEGPTVTVRETVTETPAAAATGS